MADEEAAKGKDLADEEENDCPPLKCPECEPGLPMWMATFSDLVTLLVTFFVLLLSFAKSESSKFQSALGSIRKAFGGSVLMPGKVLEKGKSVDDMPVMMESKDFISPFPIEFLTTQGFFNKHEMNRESEENLGAIKEDLKKFAMSDSVKVHEMAEGVKIALKDSILFKRGTSKISLLPKKIIENLIELLKNKDYALFIQGHASRGEKSTDGRKNAYTLSSEKAAIISQILIKRGVKPLEKITTVFYGDSRPFRVNRKEDKKRSARVEFIIRKKDLSDRGFKTHSW